MKKALTAIICALVFVMMAGSLASCEKSEKVGINELDLTKIDKNTTDLSNNKTQADMTSNQPTQKATPKFIWPVAKEDQISNTPGFGFRIHPITGAKEFHTGIDLGVKTKAKVFAAADGTIELAQWNGGYGLCIKIKHNGGIETLYAHLEQMLVKKGDSVKQGDVIGLAGATGVATDTQVHFEVLLNGKNIDPEEFIAKQK